jgi:hypothetical protein
MIHPSENNDPGDGFDETQLDRLVDAELSESERRQLLLRLEAEPHGWRRCALAFLEAQAWRQSIRGIMEPVAGIAQSGMTSNIRRMRSPRRFLMYVTALTAALVAAFALGRAWHGKTGDTAPQVLVAAGESPAAAPVRETPLPAPAGSAARGSPQTRAESSSYVDSLVKQWEQQGYYVERQKRLVSIEMKDGKRVNVPVQEVRLQYVRGRTY